MTTAPKPGPYDLGLFQQMTAIKWGDPGFNIGPFFANGTDRKFRVFIPETAGDPADYQAWMVGNDTGAALDWSNTPRLADTYRQALIYIDGNPYTSGPYYSLAGGVLPFDARPAIATTSRAIAGTFNHLDDTPYIWAELAAYDSRQSGMTYTGDTSDAGPMGFVVESLFTDIPAQAVQYDKPDTETVSQAVSALAAIANSSGLPILAQAVGNELRVEPTDPADPRESRDPFFFGGSGSAFFSGFLGVETTPAPSAGFDAGSSSTDGERVKFQDDPP